MTFDFENFDGTNSDIIEIVSSESALKLLKRSGNKNIKVYIGDKELENAKLSNPRNAVKVQGDITPGQPVDLKISLDDFDLKFSQLAQITSAVATVTDNNTREIETVTFTKQGDNLIASVPTLATKSSFNYDVLLLVVIFGASMLPENVTVPSSLHTIMSV